jgi:hypothetical protein
LADRQKGQSRPGIWSQITFPYYHDLEPVAAFYGDVMGLELVEVQGWAKIDSVGEGAILGIVAGDRGFHRPRGGKGGSPHAGGG